MLAPAPGLGWAPRAAAPSPASHPVCPPLQVAAGWLPFLDYSPAVERLFRLLHAGVGVAILGGGNWAVLLGLARYRHLTGARLLVRTPLLHRHLTGQVLEPHSLCTRLCS
jgi:ATP phosphoribosyltransferase regulatory subunit HisZ